MAESLRHRGPDSAGEHVRGDVGLAVRRLAIIDLITGDQPITSTCSGATIAYNGELYNYRELRMELEAKGHPFRTSSDTEVVLHFYEEFGLNALPRLNGMFAFAIDDPRRDCLVLVRDQLGVKPLYYSEPKAGLFLFASEPKAMFASGLVEGRIDRAGISTFLAYGHSVGDRTIYAPVRRLLPGHVAVIRDGATVVRRYWDLLARARRWESSARPPIDEVDRLLRDSVQRNMISDVPVGAFLSGGLDSSLVSCLMARETTQLRTYSVGFGAKTDELNDAWTVAHLLKTKHTEIRVSPADARDSLQDVVRAYDEPFADAAGLPTYLMAKRARADVTVVLTGEGGDEVFGGYRRYVAEQAGRLASIVPAPIRARAKEPWLERNRSLRRVGRSLRALAHTDRLRRFTTWTELFGQRERTLLLGNTSDPHEQSRQFVPSSNEIPDDVTALMFFELRTWLADGYLEKVDKATMAASLEARVPLLDQRLVELMALAPRSWRIAGTRTKTLLRDVAARHLPKQTLRKRKQGFGPPIALWLRTSLREHVDAICDSSSRLADLVDIREVRAIVEAERRGEWREAQVWALLVLGVWAEEHFRR